MSYIGRFAPSPTGPLHFGSLIAAVASFVDARANNGKWLLRMEDLDKPREIKGAAVIILQQLTQFGFEWDGEIVYQSNRTAIYNNYCHLLQKNGFAYSCTCSRKEIADSSILIGIDGAIYPKTCFKKTHPILTNNLQAVEKVEHLHAWRLNVVNVPTIFFVDAIQGKVLQNLPRDIGDFIIKRRDGFFAYQLAVVVDDAVQNITHVVRGADLLDSTPRQIYLQYLLGFSILDQTSHNQASLNQTSLDQARPNTLKINYAHIPIVVNSDCQKLSKQTLAKPINAQHAVQTLYKALCFLGQKPPAEIQNATLTETWHWAFKHWQIQNVPKTRFLSITDDDLLIDY